MKFLCQECQGSNLERLAWVDQENNITNDSLDAEEGKYWCNNCNAHYEGYYDEGYYEKEQTNG